MPYKKKLSIAILGSTGSIGKTSLKILSNNLNIFKIDLLACNKNKQIILRQINKFLPKYVIINNLNAYKILKKVKYKKKIKFFNSIKEFNNFNKKKFDKVILGISSLDGLDYAFSFIKYSNEMLIANKETIVCGGNFFLNTAKKHHCEIKSIDSEHYCLSQLLNIIDPKEIDKIYLTASGGPFLNKNLSDVSKINAKFAVKHPMWKMGKKISVDSATMANKGLEVIEASILFGINLEKIKIKIHTESKVHSVVILKNGLVYLLAHNTSMRIPIENSLLTSKSVFKNKNFFLKKNFFSLSFDEHNLKKFKMLRLAYIACNYGPRGCIFYNVVNDFLVYLYLNNKIFFYQIYDNLKKIMLNHKLKKYFKKKIKNLNDINETVLYAKECANKNL